MEGLLTSAVVTSVRGEGNVMGKVNTSRALVSCLMLIGVGACLLFGAGFIYGITIPLRRLLLFLLALPIGLVFLVESCRFFSRPKCASCGVVVYHQVPDCDPCPRCDRTFGHVANLMPQQRELPLREYLSDSRPMANSVGLVLALAIRDGVNEIRFVGRDEDSDPEAPWDDHHRSCSIWYHSKGEAYEVVPPPRHVGTGIFLVLKEICRRVPKETADGPACFRIAIDDYSEAVELTIEESEEQGVAKIVFTSESHEPWEQASRYLKEFFERRNEDTHKCGNEGSA
jgi:hypothetical protein